MSSKPQQHPNAPSQQFSAKDLVQHCAAQMKSVRQKKKITQQALADQLMLPLETVQRNESGKSKFIRLDYVWDVAIALDVPIQSLLPPQDIDIESYLQQIESCVAAIRSLLESR